MFPQTKKLHFSDFTAVPEELENFLGTSIQFSEQSLLQLEEDSDHLRDLEVQSLIESGFFEEEWDDCYNTDVDAEEEEEEEDEEDADGNPDAKENGAENEDANESEGIEVACVLAEVSDKDIHCHCHDEDNDCNEDEIVIVVEIEEDCCCCAEKQTQTEATPEANVDQKAQTEDDAEEEELLLSVIYQFVCFLGIAALNESPSTTTESKLIIQPESDGSKNVPSDAKHELGTRTRAAIVAVNTRVWDTYSKRWWWAVSCSVGTRLIRRNPHLLSVL